MIINNESFFMTNTTDGQWPTTNESTLVLLDSAQSNSTSTENPEDYVYDYDFNSSLDNYDWAELIPVVVVYSIVLLLGISGNGICKTMLIAAN